MGLKSLCLPGWFLLEALWDSLCPSFSRFQGPSPPWARGPFLMSPQPLPSLHLLSVSDLPCHSPMRTLGVTFRTHQEKPGESPHLKIHTLVTSAKSLLPTKVTFTGSDYWDVGI